jgi:hypothetical protein
MIARIGCGIVLLVAASFAVQAAELTPLSNELILNALDADGSGKLEINEINAGIIIGAHPERFSLDVPPKEKEVAALADSPAVKSQVQKFFAHHSLKPAYTFAEIDAKDLGLGLPNMTEPPAKRAALPSRVVLRRDRDSVPNVFVEEDETGKQIGQKAKGLLDKGALFSYGRDFATSTDQWTATGVLAWMQTYWSENFDLPSLNSWLLFAQWDRVDLGGDVTRDTKTLGGISPQFKTKESNSLMFGAETRQQINFPGIQGYFPAFIAKAAAYYHTDFDFQSSIPTAELDLTPVAGKFGFGSYQTEHDALYWRITASLHLDVGHVASDGRWTVSKQGTTFAHVGPKIILELMPFPKQPLVAKMPIIFTLGITKLGALTDDSRDAHEYTADASIYLRKGSAEHPFDPNVALSISLKRIDDIENKKNDDSLIAGVAIGF